jgi:hypothetical protein
LIPNEFDVSNILTFHKPVEVFLDDETGWIPTNTWRGKKEKVEKKGDEEGEKVEGEKRKGEREREEGDGR